MSGEFTTTRIADALMIRLTLTQQRHECMSGACGDACPHCTANLYAAETAAELVAWALDAWAGANREHAAETIGEAERSLYAVGGNGLAWEIFGRELCCLAGDAPQS